MRSGIMLVILSNNNSPIFFRWSKNSLMSMKERKKWWNYGIYFYCRKGEFVFHLSVEGSFAIWWNLCLNYYGEWPIKRLFKNKSFWWALVWTGCPSRPRRLLKKWKRKTVRQGNIPQKSQILSKIDFKNPPFPFFKLAPSFNWTLIRNRVLIRNICPKTGSL